MDSMYSAAMFVFFFKQKTAYEMRISDWSSDVCSSDLPLEITEPVVNYELIRMPDSTGFGDYTESGQVIPVSFDGEVGSYTHQMFLNDHPPIAGGRDRKSVV